MRGIRRPAVPAEQVDSKLELPRRVALLGSQAAEAQRLRRVARNTLPFRVHPGQRVLRHRETAVGGAAESGLKDLFKTPQ